MAEVTVKIPRDIKDILEGISETIYVEALKETARKKVPANQRRLNELRKQMSAYEKKYGKSFGAFSQNVPDTMSGHDDWIDWSYLVKVSEELSNKIEKFKLLLGK